MCLVDCGVLLYPFLESVDAWEQGGNEQKGVLTGEQIHFHET